MSDLRFFADTMQELIDAERRLAELERNASRYGAMCGEIRKTCIETRNLTAKELAEASEGINAVRIIFAKTERVA